MRRYALAGIAALAFVVALIGSGVHTTAGSGTVVVKPSAMNGWYFWNDKDETFAGSPGELVSGPGAPPAGAGSVRLGPLTDNGATAAGYSVIATDAYAGTALANITALSYSTYQPGPIQAIALQFDVRYRTTDSAYGGRLVFEPYQNGAVTVGPGWQPWSPLSGKWWATKTTAAGTGGAQVVALPAGNCALSTPCTWSEINSAFPAAVVYGRFLLKAGSGWNGFDGNADNLTVGVSGSNTTYDFEAETPCTTTCYVDAATGNDSFGGDTPGAAKKTIQAAVNQVSAGGTVNVAAGTYVEQVDIGKQIVLTGAGMGSTIIKSPAALATKFTTSAANKPVVYVHDTTGGQLTQLTVDGDGKGNANYRIEGIAFYNAGGTVDYTDIVRVRDAPLSGNQHGVALYANNADASPRTLTASYNTISDYQKNGMALNGDGLTVDVGYNTVTGSGATGLIAQNGIQVGYGATGTVHDNNVSGNACTSVSGGCTDNPTSSATADGAAGILLYVPGTGTVTVQDNILGSNQFGVWTVGATSIDVSGNNISGAGGNGIAIWDCDQWCSFGDAAGTTGTISGNTISGQNYGLLVRDYDAGAPVPAVAAHNNSISGNAPDGAWSNVALNATDNWWGSANGPVHASNTFNVGAQGDAVSSSVVFVPWLDAAPPTGVSFAPVTTTSPAGDYSSIQAGVDASSAGGTVNAKAGTFTENVTVGNEVTIAGAGETSTMVEPAFSNPVCVGGSLCGGAASNVFLVQANNVTIHDLGIDGDSPLNTSSVVVGGADIEARNGIITNHGLVTTYNNLTVHHVTVKNIYFRGIYASSGGTFDFNHDTVQNVQGEAESIGMFNWVGVGSMAFNSVSDTNDAIAANHSSGTQFLNNTVTNSGSGIHTDNAGDGGGVADLIKDNIVTNSTYGVWVFVPYIAPTLQTNTITNVDVGLAAFGQGAAVTTNFIGNIVDGQNKVGSTGAYVTTDQLGYAFGDSAANFTGNRVINNVDGFYFDASLGGTVSVTATSNCIAGNTNSGMTAAASVTGINAENNWWGRVDGANPPGHGDAISPPASIDAVPFLAAPTAGCPVPADGDGDGFNDPVDNCPSVYNADQANTDGEPMPLPKPVPVWNDVTNPAGDSDGDACDPDIDGDGVPNGTETAMGLSPYVWDTDGDRTNDGTEVLCGSNPLSAANNLSGMDTDNDRAPDACEALMGTNPNSVDSDGDGVLDGVEVRYWMSNPLSQNTDGDLCKDGKEVATVNSDRVVNSADQGIIASNFGKLSPEYRPYDMNGDGYINSADQGFLASQYGKCT